MTPSANYPLGGTQTELQRLFAQAEVTSRSPIGFWTKSGVTRDGVRLTSAAVPLEFSTCCLSASARRER